MLSTAKETTVRSYVRGGGTMSSVPDDAKHLQDNLNKIARTIDESIELASDSEIESEAILSALADADENIRTASEQLANLIGGL